VGSQVGLGSHFYSRPPGFASLALVAQAAPELSRYTITRMLFNVWVDAVTGTVPLLPGRSL